ncbi:MAG: sugar phosphate nucleotidyltransferase [bacterium]
MKKLSSIILAAGAGTRLRSEMPKALHEVCGAPILVHLLRTTEGVVNGKTVVVVGFAREKLEQTLKERGFRKVHYAFQPRQLGTGHAVQCATDCFKRYTGDILVLVGDAPLLTRKTVEQLVHRHRRQDAAATVLTTKMRRPEGYGRVLRHQDGTVLGIVEDKDANIYEKKINEVNTGMYVFDGRELFTALKNIRPDNEQREYYLPDVIQIMVDGKKRVEAVVARDYREAMGVNNRVEFARAERIMRDRILHRLMLSGVTILDPPSTFIDDGVSIGIDSIIQPNTIIRGRSSIGKGCVIGPLTQIDHSEIGDGCRINSSYISECVVSEDEQIGPFANLQAGKMVQCGEGSPNEISIKILSKRAGTGVTHATRRSSRRTSNKNR